MEFTHLQSGTYTTCYDTYIYVYVTHIHKTHVHVTHSSPLWWWWRWWWTAVPLMRWNVVRTVVLIMRRCRRGRRTRRREMRVMN